MGPMVQYPGNIILRPGGFVAAGDPNKVLGLPGTVREWLKDARARFGEADSVKGLVAR